MRTLLAFLLLTSPVYAEASRDFDGSSSLLTCQSPTALDNMAAMTFSLWIKPDGAGEGNAGTPIQKAGTSAGFTGWRLRFDSSRHLNFTVDWTTDLDVVTSDVIATTSWSHVVLTWDGSLTAANVHIYINDTEAAYGTQTDGTTTRTSDASNNVLIGNSSNSTRTFDGRMAQVELWDRVLTRQEISETQVGPGRVPSSLQQWTTLQGVSDPELDYAGNGNTCAVTATSAANADGPPIMLMDGA